MADEIAEKAGLSQMEEMLMQAGADGKMPNKKDIMDMLENSELDESLKESFKALLGGGAPQLFGTFGGGTYLGIGFVVLIFSILLFFGYKLYKSIKDKEVKREEKKKLKQMKKKK